MGSNGKPDFDVEQARLDAIAGGEDMASLDRRLDRLMEGLPSPRPDEDAASWWTRARQARKAEGNVPAGLPGIVVDLGTWKRRHQNIRLITHTQGSLMYGQSLDADAAIPTRPIKTDDQRLQVDFAKRGDQIVIKVRTVSIFALKVYRGKAGLRLVLGDSTAGAPVGSGVVIDQPLLLDQNGVSNEILLPDVPELRPLLGRVTIIERVE